MSKNLTGKKPLQKLLSFTKKHKNFFIILLLFLTWRALLFIAAWVGGSLLVFNNSFPYVNRILIFTKVPQWVWGFANFDGVHYLKLAKDGYQANFSQAFFPLYPILINLLTKINVFVPKDNLIFFPQDVERQFFYNGLMLSNLAFLASLYVLHKLFSLEYKKKVFESIFLLIAFPTAFYFGSLYSESLFLLFSSISLLFIKNKKWMVSAIFIALASLTRLVGVFLVVILVTEIIMNGGVKKLIQSGKKLLSVAVSLLGLSVYMVYLAKEHTDPLLFLNSQPAFGGGRSTLPIVTLPQVFFRYTKMLLTVDIASYQYFTILCELSFSIIAIGVIVYAYKKVKLSYLLFSLLVFLTPTLTGTLSSMPRYILAMYPIMPAITQSISNKRLVFIIALFLILQLVFTALFTSGYWIA